MRRLSTGVLCLAVMNANANVIQYFSGISYNNPAELSSIKNTEFIIGSTVAYADLEFNGSALNFNTFHYDSGINHSRTWTFFPYGRIAKRINKQFVFSVDVTEPFNSNLDWGNNAFTRYAATQNIFTDVDISPKIAFAVNQNLQLGAGINFNFIANNEINWVMPTGPITSANLVNVTTSSGVGGNFGLNYVINPTNILGLTYYTEIKQNTHGYSQLDSMVSNNLILNIKMPPTTILSYLHIFNPAWLVNLKVFRTEWNVDQQARFYNTAPPPPFNNFIFTMNFKTSYAFLAAVRHQFMDNLGFTFLGMVDNGPEHEDLRTITFPSYVQYFLGVVADYHVNPTTSFELLLGHGVSTPPIHNCVTTNNGSIPFTTGKVDINANVVDFKVKIEV